MALQGSDDEDDVTAESLRLLLPPPKATGLEDDKKLTDYEIKNDNIIHVIFQISENQWETVNVDSTDISSTAGS